MEFSIRTVLCAIDLGPHGEEAACHAIGLARQFGAKLHLVHVIEPLSDYLNVLIANYVPSEVQDTMRQQDFKAARQEMEQRLAQFCQDLAVDPAILSTNKVVEGSPHQAILDEAVSIAADIIVLGSHGHTAVGEIFLGSVAHKVIMKSAIPVLLVPIRGG
jgi:nucleotide-binding universal stress UspA family protein